MDHKTRETATCATCGKSFEPDKPGRKFCSRDCYHAFQIGHPRLDLRRRETRTCVVCGKEFETGGRAGSRNKEFCSWECRYRGRYRSGKQANPLSPTDAAYLAGFIDGEGTIMLHRRRDGASLRLTAANTDLAVLNWIAETTGVGSVITTHKATDRWSTGYTWQVDSEGAETVIQQIRPYLHIKRTQAELALVFHEKLRDPALKADRTWQLEALNQMQKLNQRGPTATAGG